MHKRTIIKEEKNRIPSLSCKHREKYLSFLANHFCKWLPAEAGRRPPAPGHCTVFMCNKHATLALKPFGAGLLGCDCSGQSSYYLNTRTAPTNNSNRASGPGPANVSTTLTFEPRALTIRTEPGHFIFFKRVCTIHYATLSYCISQKLKRSLLWVSTSPLMLHTTVQVQIRHLEGWVVLYNMLYTTLVMASW